MKKPKLTLHHINLASTNVVAMDQFYREVLGLGDDDPQALPPISSDNEVVGEVAFVTDGAVQVHLSQKDVLSSFKTGKLVNPLERGHIAYRTDDLEAFKAHLEAQGVPYADWGSTAVAGWQQIFFYDPEGNIIEVHEVG